MSQGNSQWQRLAQLRAMEPGELEQLMEHMANADRLPRRRLHFRKHGVSLGAASEEEYEHLFREHVRRHDLRLFTFLRRRDGNAIWYLIAPDSGAIAMYNETRGTYWSFFWNSNITKFLEDIRGEWVEVIPGDNDWQFQPW